MEFVAIDVETANADMASICQIVLAMFKDGKLVDEWSSLVNPEDYFDPINVGIHGIKEQDITDAPSFPQIFAELCEYLSSSVCVSHTHFDRVSIGQAISKYSLKQLNAVWLDSARVACRTWDECAWRGYGLPMCVKLLGINLSIMTRWKMQKPLVRS